MKVNTKRIKRTIDLFLPLIIAITFIYLFGPWIGMFLAVLVGMIVANLKVFGGITPKNEEDDEPPI